MKTIHEDRRRRLRQARHQTDEIFRVLQPGAIYDRPVPERHRLIFYLGHVEAFDWNHICVRGTTEPQFHPAFDKLFEAGIDPEIGKAPSDQPTDWPTVEEVLAYRDRVRRRVDDLVSSAPVDIVEMALEHRFMHAETLAYLIHNLPHDRKIEQTEQFPTDEEIRRESTRISEGIATLGKQRNNSFGWDNEFEQISVPVPSFEVDRYKVTNGDYLEFVKEGKPAPFFWTARNGSYRVRGMFREIALPLSWPVYVTHNEATQYASWKSSRLLTEAEYHRAAYGNDDGPERMFPWGDTEPSPKHGNFGFKRWDPLPVNTDPEGSSAFGVAQLAGNGWEWTSSIFEPFPGFQPAGNYPGYSADFFDGQHYVMKGASPRTAPCFLRRSFRNWFRPNYPYVYATFRCARD